MINSFVIYVLTYLLTYLVFQSITLLFARIAGIRGSVYYYEIFYAASSSWTAGKIIFVNSGGPFCLLLTGILIMVFLKKPWRRTSPYIKLFFLWTGFHCFNFFIGGILSGTITGMGFGYAIDYIFKRPMGLYLFIDLSAVVMLSAFGYSYSRHFIAASPTFFWAEEINRARYLMFAGVIPWLAGSALIFFLKYPDNEPQHNLIVLHDLILMITMGIIVVAMIFNKRHFKVRLKQSAVENLPDIHVGFATSALILILLFRLVLTRGFYSLFG